MERLTAPLVFRMSDLLHDPFVQSSVLPLLAGLLAVGVLHAAARRLAAAGIGIAFLIIHALVVGVPDLPPPSSTGKLFWASAAGVILGAAADATGLRGRAGSALVALWLAASLAWIALPVLDSPTAGLTLLVLIAAGVWIAVTSAADNGEDGPTAPAAAVLALGLAVGGTALIGSSASVAQMALALAAATGGFLLWNWPVERHAWGVSGQAAAGLAVLLAGVLALFTQAQAPVLLLALPAALAGRVRRRLPVPVSAAGRAMVAAAVTAVAVLPALVAVGAAFLLSDADASPY